MKNKITSQEMFNFHKPKYNGFGVKCGPHGDTKYNRRKEKQKFHRDMENW